MHIVNSNYRMNKASIMTMPTYQYLIELPNKSEESIETSSDSSNKIEMASSKKLDTLQQKKRYNSNPVIEYYKNPFDYSRITENAATEYAVIHKRVLRKISEKKIWNCLLCPEKRTSKEGILDHYENHKKATDLLKDDGEENVTNSFACPACDFKFDDAEKFKRHVLLKHGPKEYYCEICKYGLANYVFLTVHNMIHHNEDKETMICAACKTFSTKSNDDLIAHIELNHIKDNFFCSECEDTFVSKEWYENHKMFHIKSQNTRYGKDTSSYLRNSKTVRNILNKPNADKKPTKNKQTKLICPVCNLTFPWQKNLENHMRLMHHINKETFLCSTCGKSFERSRALNHHIKTHKSKEHICSTCGKQFTQWQNLKIHIRTHTGEKPHKCQYCNKSFAQRPPLNLHLRTHTGERPYSCKNCSKGFISKTVRDSHQRRCNK